MKSILQKMVVFVAIVTATHSTVMAQGVWNPGTGIYQLDRPDYDVNIDENGFRFSFSGFGAGPVPAHQTHGLALGRSAIQSILSVDHVNGHDEIRVQAANGALGTVTVYAMDNALRFNVSPDIAATITTQTGSVSNAAAFGLADAVATRSSTNLAGGTYQVMKNDGNVNRFASSFMIHPSQRFAGVSFYPSDTTVTTNSSRYSMTTHNTGGGGDFKDVDVYYFMGELDNIYSAYKSARVEQGYPGSAPKSQWFELGYESWPQLRWNANGATVQNSLQNYLANGIPIKWAVTGSGFWEDDHTTTSFGFLDQSPGEYPNPTSPTGFGTWTEANNIAWIIGQRTSFVRDTDNNPGPVNADKNGYVRGPFTDEAENAGYFVNNLDGSTYVSQNSWYPQTPAYVLDGTNPSAAEWFRQKFDLWKQYGIDGVKEDTGASGATSSKLKRTDVFNGPMRALADDGTFVMGRDGAFTMPGTLHRLNDPVLGDITGRIPITLLQYAASGGAPNGYADTVGSLNSMGNSSVREGILRQAWALTLTGGISFSAAPWETGWSQADQDVLMNIVGFRHSLTPYIHSAAVESYESGFPHTMTPLYLAYPDDANTYNLANTSSRQFEWMVGPSLLAAPLLTTINGTTDEMDIYLPDGQWIDYHTGIQYTGGQTLTDFVMDINRPPVFVGGKGILVLRSFDEQTMFGEVFPNAPSGTEYTFHSMDGQSETNISTAHGTWNPGTLRIRDLTLGQDVSFTVQPNTGALRFVIQAGHDYQLLGAPVGDFDGDGVASLSDIDALVAEVVFGRDDLAFDLTGDGFVNTGDVAAWLIAAGSLSSATEGQPFLPADANLDGVVDTIDFNIWNDHRFSFSPAWSTADFNADGAVDLADLHIWNRYKFQSSSDVVSVPEPTLPVSLWVMALVQILRSGKWSARLARYAHP